MQININEKNEIISYAVVGSIYDGFDIDQKNICDGFEENFKPSYFVYEDGEILLNENYKEQIDEAIDVKKIILMNKELLNQNEELISRVEKLENQINV